MEFGSGDIFIAGHTLLDTVDNLERSVDPDVRCDEDLLQIIEHLIVDGRFSGHGACQFLPYALFGLLQTLIKFLLLLLAGKQFVEYTHVYEFLR